MATHATRIITPIASIAALSFVPWPRHRVVLTKAIRRENYKTFGLLAKNGAIAVSDLERRKYRMTSYNQEGVALHASWVKDALAAAVDFRVVSRDDYLKFMEPIEQYWVARSHCNDAEQFETLADALGIKLTKPQNRRLASFQIKRPKGMKS